MNRAHLPALAGLVLALSAAGCAAGSPHAQTRQTAASKPAPRRPVPAPPQTRPRQVFTSCGHHVQALAKTTSCAFATSLFWTYYDARTRTFAAFSPTTSKTYQATCTGERIVTCTAGVGAKVRFPMSAINAQDRRDAAATLPAAPAPPAATTPASPPPTEGCDQPGDVCNSEGMNLRSPYFKELCRQLYQQWKQGDPITGETSEESDAAIVRYGQLLCDQTP